MSGHNQGRLLESQNKSTLVKLVLEASQQTSNQASLSSQLQTRSQSAALKSGRVTGIHANGWRTQPSIRGRRGQWEMVDSDEKILSYITFRERM